jgi:PAS domain S-box-containing protein
MPLSSPADTSAFLRTVLDTVMDGIFVIEEGGAILTVSPAAARMFGYSPAELIGHNLKMLMPEPDRGRHDSYIKRYVDTGEARIIGTGREVAGRRKDGSVFPLHLSVDEMQPNHVRRFVGVVRDISRLRETEQGLRISELPRDGTADRQNRQL